MSKRLYSKEIGNCGDCPHLIALTKFKFKCELSLGLKLSVNLIAAPPIIAEREVFPIDKFYGVIPDKCPLPKVE